MSNVTAWFGQVRTWLEIPLLKLGTATITLWTLVYFLILLVVLFYVAGKLRHWLVKRVLVKTSLDEGARQAIGSITRYLTLLIGLLIALQTVGIDLTTLNVLAGAVGIGPMGRASVRSSIVMVGVAGGREGAGGGAGGRGRRGGCCRGWYCW